MKCTLAVLYLLVAVVPGFAQPAQTSTAPPSHSTSAASAQTKDPVTASLRMLLPRSRNNILGAITAMPADKFNYKPTPEQMSFAHLVVHIIGSNNSMCAKAADIAEPKVEETKETDAKDKLLAAATASFDFCGDALGKMDDSKLGDSVELFAGHQFPRAMAALGLASGWADHYAAAAMYLRLNNILPPSAQPKK
ncbi:MAG: DinB family protein [Candidatus Sulfotelmatobacter sp.]